MLFAVFTNEWNSTENLFTWLFYFIFFLIACFKRVLSVFIQGKAHRDKQLVYLKDHLDKYYHSRDRKWIVLFPEGGFLRKRRETSQLFAKKNSLPHLTHVTLPRLGATHVILKTLSAQQENGSVGSDAGTLNQTGNQMASDTSFLHVEMFFKALWNCISIL